MLLSISAQLKAASSDGSGGMQRLVSRPPWTGNESDADAPTALVASLGTALRAFVSTKLEMLTTVDELINSLSAAVDHALRERTRSLVEIATFDSLTGALTRRAAMERLDAECARTVRHGHPLSVIYIDVDSLKSTNDERGHRAGDDLLVRLVDLVSSNIRASDALGRIGGDEFLLILPDTDLKGALSVESKLYAVLDGVETGASLGTAATPGSEASAESLVDAADAAMRAAKAKRA